MPDHKQHSYCDGVTINYIDTATKKNVFILAIARLGPSILSKFLKKTFLNSIPQTPIFLSC